MSSNSPIAIPHELTTALQQAQRVTILTGAGISAESGLSTFRDAQTGLWANFRPEDMATPEAFERNPRQVWEWYAWRRELVEKAEPNAGHRALVEMERRVSHLTLITQNVDGLHQRAGSKSVIELHGNIMSVKCSRENTIVETFQAGEDLPPHCPNCGGLLRPNVVWFGEMLPEASFEQAVEAAADCDLFFSIGTSGLVEPAASLAKVAQQFGAVVVFLNLDVEPFSAPKLYHLHGCAGVLLPELLKATWPE